jgi:formylglycine-generating enzyme required for sulfatase activity
MDLFSRTLSLLALVAGSLLAEGLPTEHADRFTWTNNELRFELADPEPLRIDGFDASGRHSMPTLSQWFERGNYILPLPFRSNCPLWIRITGPRGQFLLRKDLVASTASFLGTPPTGMRRIPAGKWLIGSPDKESGRYDDEIQHAIQLSAFWIDTTETNRAEFLRLMNYAPSLAPCLGNCPVDNVSWYEAILFCNARSRREFRDTVYSYANKLFDTSGHLKKLDKLVRNPSANGFQLPTEAQWEIAARAGTGTPWGWGIDSTLAASYSWLAWNSSNTSHKVGTLASNAWGMHDMQGNVWEWTWDWYNGYDLSESLDPAGFGWGDMKSYRGGSWRSSVASLRIALRNGAAPIYKADDLGFRCVRKALE